MRGYRGRQWAPLGLLSILVACSAGVENGTGALTFGQPTAAGPVATSDGETGNITTSVSAGASATEGDSDAGSESSATTSASPPVCGDGTLQTGEDCDGEDFGAQSCGDLGFDDGLLICNKACQLLTEGCRSCGDDSLSMSEACDGDLFGEVTCDSLGFSPGGVLGCSADCSAVDTSGCNPLPTCGDGLRNGAEACDGADLGGATCMSLGFDLGVLTCLPGSCTFNVAGCQTLTCTPDGGFCIFNADDPQGDCCPAGVGGTTFGLCVGIVCQ